MGASVSSEGSRYDLVRMGAFGRFLFVGSALALVAYAVFCLTYTVDLRCEHVAERDLFCTVHTRSAVHDTVQTIDAHGADDVTASARLVPPTRQAVAAELDAFVQSEDDAAYVRHVSTEPLLLALLGALTLFFPIALWRAIRSTRVIVDRQASTVTISRCLLGVVTSRKVVSLRETVTVVGKQKRSGQDLFLQLARGAPVHIAWVPQHKAVTDFAALKRLFPVGG